MSSANSTKDLYEVDEEAKEEFKNFKLRRKYRWVQFGIEEVDGKKIHKVKEVEADRSKSVDDLLKALPEHDCRYVVFDYEYKTKDGRKADTVYFIQWNPRAAATALQMDYLTGRPAIRDVCEGCIDISAATANDVRSGVFGNDDANESDQDEVEDGDDWLD